MSAGASSSRVHDKHHDTGEFTDDEDTGIPLEDIREAEFDRLEHSSATRETMDSSGANKSLSSWLPWLGKRQQKESLGEYAQLGEDEGLPTARGRPGNALNSTATPKEWSCDSKVEWGILYLDDPLPRTCRVPD